MYVKCGPEVKVVSKEQGYQSFEFHLEHPKVCPSASSSLIEFASRSQLESDSIDSNSDLDQALSSFETEIQGNADADSEHHFGPDPSPNGGLDAPLPTFPSFFAGVSYEKMQLLDNSPFKSYKVDEIWGQSAKSRAVYMQDVATGRELIYYFDVDPNKMGTAYTWNNKPGAVERCQYFTTPSPYPGRLPYPLFQFSTIPAFTFTSLNDQTCPDPAFYQLSSDATCAKYSIKTFPYSYSDYADTYWTDYKFKPASSKRTIDVTYHRKKRTPLLITSTCTDCPYIHIRFNPKIKPFSETVDER